MKRECLTVSLFVILSMFCKLSRSFSIGLQGPRLHALSLAASSIKRSSTYTRNTIPKIDVASTQTLTYSGDLLVIPFYKPVGEEKIRSSDAAFAAALLQHIPTGVDEHARQVISDVLQDGVFKAEVSSKQLIRLHGASGSLKYVALVGLGPDPKKGKVGDMDVKSASRLGKSIAALAKEMKATSVGVIMPPAVDNAGVSPMLVAIQDALYVDERFKKVPDDGFPQLQWKSLTLLGCSTPVHENIALTSRLSSMIASGVQLTKDLVGAPPCAKTPVAIAQLAKAMAAEHNLECKVLGQAECEALNMGGYLGVQQGSRFPPQFVHLTYRAENPGPDTVKVALVGKGLTFDSGGYNLKSGPGSMIELMKFDMGGCGAVLGAAKAIGQLRPKNLEVHFISAVCENMVSADAMRPGDVLVASNGKTIEVINTDAEGRLTLADALVYAEKLQVDRIVDLATLTGACIVGLGEKIAALYSSDDALLADLQAAAKRTDEVVWAMPLESSYKESIKGSITDLKNLSGAKGGGSITAALFLQEFVEKTPWAHIDMAGPVWQDNKPTGFGVKLLVDYLLNARKSK